MWNSEKKIPGFKRSTAEAYFRASRAALIAIENKISTSSFRRMKLEDTQIDTHHRKKS